MATRTLTIPARCPLSAEHRDMAVQRIRQRLLSMAGMRDVRVQFDDGQEQATLALDYDPRMLALSQLEREAAAAGMLLSTDRAELLLGIEGMASPRSEQAIEAALAKLPGVVASASYPSRSLRVEFDRSQCALPEIARRLDHAGFRITGTITQARLQERAAQAVEDSASITTLTHFVREYRQLASAIIGGVFLLAAFIVHRAGGSLWLYIPLISIAYVSAGWYTAKDTFHVLRSFRFDIDVLMFAAAFGAASLGKFEEGALLLFLFALGGAGEQLAMDRARRAIAALAKLAPETATIRNADGSEKLVLIGDLKIGDPVLIRPFDRMPADGVVSSGASAVDQSPITGESIPAEKVAGDPVFAGTINGEGMLIVSVTRLASESTLARIIKMVSEAQTTKSPTQVFTDKVEKFYVPCVLIGTALVMLGPPLLFDPQWAKWFYRSMAFLTAASPCALAIGTPAAILSGIARAARLGVLIKGGVHLENLGRVKAVALDKTGTLTRGRPELTNIAVLGEMVENDLLAIASAVESASSHPLAAAIVAEARARQLPVLVATGVEQIPARGMRASVDGKVVHVGHVELLAADSPGAAKAMEQIQRFSAEGKTTVVVAVDGRAAGVIALADRPRDNAAQAIAALKRLGVVRTVMLTGDNRFVAAAVAKECGVDEFRAALLPDQKATIIGELQAQYGYVAMIGDGVNDAPAMAAATVGIAMGGAGADVALETADVALMADDLGKLPVAIGLSRYSRRIIKQNLVIALGVISLLAPAAALGFAPLGLAVLFHEGSTVVVVLNSMRLLLWKPSHLAA